LIFGFTLAYNGPMGKDGFSFNVIWIFLLFSCLINCGNSKTKNDRSVESLKIYRLIIDQFYIEKENQPVVIDQFSMKFEWFYNAKSIFTPLEINRDTLEDFERINQFPSKIADYFPLDSGYVFVSSPDEGSEKSIWRYRNYLKRVKKLFPDSGGIITFSKIGFNKQMNQGLVEFKITPADGRYRYQTVLLKKKKAPAPCNWTIEQSYPGVHAD
jgi:hypothetical protein